MEYKLIISILGLGGDPAILEYKLSKCLGLAATTKPGIQYNYLGIWALSACLGLAASSKSWNTSYVGAWARRRPTILEYKLSGCLGLDN